MKTREKFQNFRIYVRISGPNSNFRTFQDKFQNFRNFRTTPRTAVARQQTDLMLLADDKQLIAFNLELLLNNLLLLVIVRLTLQCSPVIVMSKLLSFSIHISSITQQRCTKKIMKYFSEVKITKKRSYTNNIISLSLLFHY